MVPRKRHNSSRVNLTISVIFHSILIAGIFFLAAREGYLGKTLRQITVTMVPKTKPPEPPKVKPPEPKSEPAKQPAATPRPTLAPPPLQTASAAPPPSSLAAPPPAAPPAADVPLVQFTEGAKDVNTSSDPIALYKGLVEHALRSHWERPEDIADETFEAEAEVSISPTGLVSGSQWLKGSGIARWDDSVKSALNKTKAIGKAPPKGFPGSFMVRFDVQSEATEGVMPLSMQ